MEIGQISVPDFILRGFGRALYWLTFHLCWQTYRRVSRQSNLKKEGYSRLNMTGERRRLRDVSPSARRRLWAWGKSRLPPMALRYRTGHNGPMESGLKIETQWPGRGGGKAGFEVYRGKGRHARRLHRSAPGGFLFRMFMAWVRGKA